MGKRFSHFYVIRKLLLLVLHGTQSAFIIRGREIYPQLISPNHPAFPIHSN